MIDSKIYDENGQHTQEFIDEILSLLEAKSNDLAKILVSWLDSKDAPIADYFFAYQVIKDLADLYTLGQWMNRIEAPKDGE